MGEPVGNGPRVNIPGNSHREREAKQPEPETREPIEKVVTGKVIKRKQPWYKRASRSIVADDAQSIGDFLLTDVLIPSVKTLIMNMVEQGTSRALFGTSTNVRRNANHINYSRGVGGIRTKYDRMDENPRQLSRSARARHDFDEVVLDNREEAVSVVEALIGMVERYGQASVSDLYDLVGVTGSFADQKWGWSNLDTADVRQARGGFLLDLPRPEQLR